MTQYTLTVQPDDVYKGKWMVVINGDKLIGIPARGLSKAEAESRLQCLAFAYEFGLREATACVGATRWIVRAVTLAAHKCDLATKAPEQVKSKP